LITKRLLVSTLVSTIMFGGCAHSVRETSHPPLDQQTQIPMYRLLPGDQLQPHQVLYGELADNQRIQPDGTIELTRITGKSSAKPCESSALCTTTAIIAYPVFPFIVLGAAIVVLPYLAAKELLKAPDAKAAAIASKPENNEVDLRDERERILSQERHAQWLATVVMEGQWPSALDDSYISALNQALGWEAPPLRGSVEQHRQLRLGTGISRIMLLDSKLGERTLILCARSSVERAGVTVRHFETCQSGNIGPAMPYDSPASSEALRAVLLERTWKLAALQAKALTEQSEFIQGKW
jgi:hypothetical protein